MKKLLSVIIIIILVIILFGCVHEVDRVNYIQGEGFQVIYSMGGYYFLITDGNRIGIANISSETVANISQNTAIVWIDGWEKIE